MTKTTWRNAFPCMVIAMLHPLSRLRQYASLIVAILLLTGCAELLRDPVSPTSARVQPDGFDHVRYYPLGGVLDNPSSEIPLALDRAYVGETADNYEFGPDGVPVYNYLAVSGGGSDGAFGAGLLNGWSKHGGRPKFKIVTGVSTGSFVIAAKLTAISSGPVVSGPSGARDEKMMTTTSVAPWVRPPTP